MGTALITCVVLATLWAMHSCSTMECGPYGFRCVNDNVYEICSTIKRGSGESYEYTPVGSRIACPKGRSCDGENPHRCTYKRAVDQQQRCVHNKTCGCTTTTEETDTDDDEVEEPCTTTESSCGCHKTTESSCGCNRTTTSGGFGCGCKKTTTESSCGCKKTTTAPRSCLFSYPCIRGGNFPDLSDKNRYYRCSMNEEGNGYVSLRKRCRKAEVFHSGLKRCVPVGQLMEKSKRSVAERSQKMGRRAQRVGHRCHRKKTTTHRPCPYTPDEEPPADVPPPPPLPPPSYPENEQDDQQDDQQEPEVPIPEQDTEEPEEPPVPQPPFECKNAGKFADPYNCTTFFVCHPKRSPGRGYYEILMSCPKGQQFSPEDHKCMPAQPECDQDDKSLAGGTFYQRPNSLLD